MKLTEKQAHKNLLMSKLVPLLNFVPCRPTTLKSFQSLSYLKSTCLHTHTHRKAERQMERDPLTPELFPKFLQ